MAFVVMAGPIVRNCLGVDIGAYSIRVSQVELGKAGPRVTSLIEQRLQVEPDLDETQRFQAIAKQIQELLKAEKVRTKDAVFSVPGQSVFVRTFKLPRATPERLELMVRFEARQQIPFPLDKTIMEYQIFDDPDVPEIDVLLVAIKREYIDHFMKFVSRTGLRPIGISVSTLALYNFHELNGSSRDLMEIFKKKKQEKKKKNVESAEDEAEEGKPKKKKKSLGGLFKKKVKDEAVEKASSVEEPGSDDEFDQVGFEEIQAYVNLGHSLMDVAIPKTGRHHMIGFPRSVPVAGNEMDRAIRDRLSLGTLAEANEIKNSSCAALAAEFEIEGDPESVNMEASEAVSAVADRMISELRRSLDYYISQPDGVAVDSIVLSGGLSRMPFIANYIEEKMGIGVSLTESQNQQLRLPENFSGSISPFAISLGLALQGLQLTQNRIDFLPEDLKSLYGMRGRKGELAAVTAMLAVILVLNIGVGDNYTMQFKRLIDSYDLQKEQYADESAKIKEALSAQTKLKGAFEQTAEVAGWRDYWLRLLAVVVERRPSELLVDGIELEADGVVSISGVSTKQSNINLFIERLKNLEYDFEGSKIQMVGDTAMEDLRPVSDYRFPNQVYSYKVRLLTRKRDARIREVGVPPAEPEQAAVQAGFTMGVPPGGGI